MRKKIMIRKNKKGVEIAMNTVVAAAIALIAFIFMVFLMTDKFGLFNDTIKDCEVNQGKVMLETECKDQTGTALGKSDKETKEVCCITQCSLMHGDCVKTCEENSEYDCKSVIGCSNCKIQK